jgi:uncharacterized protein (TIGR02246 family)
MKNAVRKFLILILFSLCSIVPAPFLRAESSIVECDRQGDMQSMTPEDIRSIIDRAAKAWMNGDAELFASLFLPDGEFIVPGNRWVGREQIRQVLADFASNVAEVKIEIQRIIIDGNLAVVEWHWQEQSKETGKIERAEDAIVVDFKDGSIERWREYIDKL